MRYYVYVSDAKLDMLFPQIPENVLKGITAELSVNVQAVKVSLRHEPSEETRFSKLRVVEKFIQDAGKVGTVNEPGSYFRGTAALRWGTAGQGTVYWGGFTGETILGLAGSARHVLKGSTAPDMETWSFAPDILNGIRSYVSTLYAKGDDSAAVPGGDFMLRHTPGLADVGAMEDFVAQFTAQLPGPQQRVEFLARKLIYSPIPGLPAEIDGWRQKWWAPGEYRRVLLGTPLYVALADE